MFCKSCGTMLENGTAFCSRCGAAVTPNPAPQQPPYQQPYRQPYQQPMYQPPYRAVQAQPDPNTTKGVVYQSLRSPLAVVMAVAITVFAVLSVIMQPNALISTIIYFVDDLKYMEAIDVFYYLTDVLWILLRIAGWVALPVGIWMMLFPNDRRFPQGAKVASLGAGLLAAMQGVAVLYWVCYAIQTLTDLRYPDADDVWDILGDAMAHVIAYLVVALFFVLVSRFINMMAYYVRNNAAHVQRSCGKGVAIASFVMAFALLVCIIGAQLVSYDHPLGRVFWAYGRLWYEAIVGILVFSSFGAFALKLSLDTDKLCIR